MRFKVLLNEEIREIEVKRQGSRLLISYGDQSFEVQLIHTDGPHFVLEVEEKQADGFIRRKRIRAAGHVDGDNRQLWANGRLVNYKRLPDGDSTPVDTGSGSLAAKIPSVVTEIRVKVGDKVKSGDTLILLESMKMILPIQAPNDGMIEKLNCQVGQAVQPGVQLIELVDNPS